MNDSETWQELEAAIGDRFLLVRESAQSSGIAVFSATSRADGSVVEIKAVHRSLLPGFSAPSEAELAVRRLQHPNVLSTLEAGVTDRVVYWILPTVDGRTLRARMGRGGRMELRDALTVLRDISAALTHAHLHGVVHGGLSPDSVVISGGSALISDVGLPEVFASLRRSVGNHAESARSIEPLRYAAPEQVAGAVSDARSDVYSWGIVGYELLGGRHPFAGRTTPRQMMAAHTDEEPLQLVTGPSSVPSNVARLVMRCLAKEPARRPESAREVFAVMTKEMLVPPPAPKAGSGQKIVTAVLVAAVIVIAIIAWLGMRG